MFTVFYIDDQNILNVLNRLKNPGESAIFGGYIRDKILNIEPKDIDIVTTLSSEQVSELFPRANVRETLSGYKVFSFSHGKNHFEVIPDALNIKEKSFNADLNVNSLLYDGENLIDVTNSLPDFDSKIITSIGNTFTDKVEISPFIWLKPFRLASITGFEIDESLFNQLKQTMDIYESISDNIIKQEGYKIMDSDYPGIALKNLAKLGIVSDFQLNNNVSVYNLKKTANNYELRLVYLSELFSKKTISDFISFFKVPELIVTKYKELLEVYEGKDTTNFKLLNQKLILVRLLQKK